MRLRRLGHRRVLEIDTQRAVLDADVREREGLRARERGAVGEREQAHPGEDEGGRGHGDEDHREAQREQADHERQRRALLVAGPRAPDGRPHPPHGRPENRETGRVALAERVTDGGAAPNSEGTSGIGTARSIATVTVPPRDGHGATGAHPIETEA